MNILDAGFNHSVFSKNKERLLRADVSREFFTEIVDQARSRGLLSDEHFSVDGTLFDAWASMKSFRPKGEDGPPPGDGGRNRAVDFRGERRVNETHESRTYPGSYDGGFASKGLPVVPPVPNGTGGFRQSQGSVAFRDSDPQTLPSHCQDASREGTIASA